MENAVLRDGSQQCSSEAIVAVPTDNQQIRVLGGIQQCLGRVALHPSLVYASRRFFRDRVVNCCGEHLPFHMGEFFWIVDLPLGKG